MSETAMATHEITMCLFRRAAPRLVCGFCLLAQPLSAASDSTNTPDVPAIVQRYYYAVGGYDRILSTRTLRMRGTYREGTFQASTIMERERPNLRVVSVGGFCEGYDGAAWEQDPRTGKVTRTHGAASIASRHGAEFDESLVNAAAKGTKLTVLGASVIGGHKTWKVLATLSDGWRKDYYIDKSTGLIVALIVSMPIHARGKPVTSISYYEDYRRVDDLLFPFRQVERNERTGKVMNVLQWTSVVANPTVAPTDFSPPCKVRP